MSRSRLCPDPHAHRTHYQFLHRAGNTYYWESVRPMAGDSRHEQIVCSVDYFWNPRKAAR